MISFKKDKTTMTKKLNIIKILLFVLVFATSIGNGILTNQYMKAGCRVYSPPECVVKVVTNKGSRFAYISEVQHENLNYIGFLSAFLILTLMAIGGYEIWLFYQNKIKFLENMGLKELYNFCKRKRLSFWGFRLNKFKGFDLYCINTLKDYLSPDGVQMVNKQIDNIYIIKSHLDPKLSSPMQDQAMSEIMTYGKRAYKVKKFKFNNDGMLAHGSFEYDNYAKIKVNYYVYNGLLFILSYETTINLKNIDENKLKLKSFEVINGSYKK